MLKQLHQVFNFNIENFSQNEENGAVFSKFIFNFSSVLSFDNLSFKIMNLQYL